MSYNSQSYGLRRLKLCISHRKAMGYGSRFYFLSVRKSIIRRMAREQAGQNGA